MGIPLIMALSLLVQGLLINLLPGVLVGNNLPVSNSKLIDSEKSAVVKIVGYRVVSGGERSIFWGIPQMERIEGSGFVVTSNGEILTNKHVVETRAKYTVKTDNGLDYTVQNIYRDPTDDIAVIKIDPNEHRGNRLTVLSLEDSKVGNGQPVITVADDPGDFTPIVLTGEVTGVGKTILAGDSGTRFRERLSNVIQTSVSLMPGNSGSPLLDAQGKVIGINTATAGEIVNGNSVSFAIPIEAGKKFLETINN